MTRKTKQPEHAEDARIVSSARNPSAAPAIFDLVEVAAAATHLFARMSESAQEIQLAQLNAAAACSSAMAAVASQTQLAGGLDATVPAMKASGRAVVTAIRQSQDAWRHSMASLQEDLTTEMRGRADAWRARFEEMWTSRPADSSRQPEDAADVLNQVRRSFDTWMAHWTAMVMPRPVPIA